MYEFRERNKWNHSIFLKHVNKWPNRNLRVPTYRLNKGESCVMGSRVYVCVLDVVRLLWLWNWMLDVLMDVCLAQLTSNVRFHCLNNIYLYCLHLYGFGWKYAWGGIAPACAGIFCQFYFFYLQFRNERAQTNDYPIFLFSLHYLYFYSSPSTPRSRH